DQRLATQRGEAPGRLADLLPLEDADHAEALAALHAGTDHVQVARLEDLQVEGAAGKQHGVEREQRIAHRQALIRSTPPPAAAEWRSAAPSDSSPGRRRRRSPRSPATRGRYPL